MARSPDYVFTVQANDPRFNDLIESVRRTVKSMNDMEKIIPPQFGENSYLGRYKIKKRYIMRVRGRLGKNSVFSYLYRRGGPLHSYCSQEIRHEHSKRFDVYIGCRYEYVPVMWVE